MNSFQSIETTAATLGIHLYPTERLICVQEGVGIYNGKDRSKNHETGRIQLTSHRIIYIDSQFPLKHSIYLDLSLIRQTEYWIGIYFKSSPKITLVIGPSDGATEVTSTEESDSGSTSNSNWVCRVCGMSNSGLFSGKCGLCGVVNSVTALPPRLSTPNLSTTSLPNLITESTTIKKQVGILCPICTFLNHPSMAQCEVCDSKLGNISLPKSASTTSLPLSKVNSEISTTLPFIKLSFRKGGEKVFHSNLKKALGDRVWESDELVVKASNGKKIGGGGIDAIMKGMALEARGREDSIEDAMQDLDALMAKAKDMIHLAQSINEKLSVQEATTSLPENSDSTMIRSSLVTLGLPTPAVTSDMMASDRVYHEELAKELGSLLSSSVMGKAGRGIVGLDEIWCIWNRARGIALVSPKDLRLSAPHLALYTSPQIQLLRLPSGLTVLHTPRFSPYNFGKRLMSALNYRHILYVSTLAEELEESERIRDGMSYLEISKEEGIPFGVVRELVEMVEEQGGICRDDQAVDGVRWFNNFFG